MGIAVRDLEATLYGSGGGTGWEGRRLAAALERFDKTRRADARSTRAALLSPLNPR